MPHLCRGRYRRGQDNGMTRSTRVRGNQAVRKIIVGLFVLGFVGVGAGLWTSPAAEEPAKQTEEKGPASAEAGGECCKAGDTTPPTELVDKIAAGQLHSPYPDYAKLAKEQDLVKDFRLPDATSVTVVAAAAACAQPCRKASGSGATPMMCCSGSRHWAQRSWKNGASIASPMGACMPPCRRWDLPSRPRTTFGRSSPSSVRSILLEPILPKKWFLQG